jgi:7-cyano-7-deazaguanine synthase
MKVVVVLSGGMDSAVALADAIHSGHDVVGAVNFNYGSKHNDAEYRHAVMISQYYVTPLRRVALPFINELFSSDLLQSGGEIPDGHYADVSMKKTVVPFRNGIMLSIAAGYAESIGADGIVIGNHFGDHSIYPDCRSGFIASMGNAIAEGTYARIELLSPFCNISKADIAMRGARLQVPFEKTWSCYKGLDQHCGKCGTCVERKEAFERAGLIDPTVYLA